MGRYARIKLQTNVAIPWLIETAHEHGSNMQVTSNKNSNPLATPTQTSSTSSAKTGRLKGKARKEAKKMEQPQVQASSPKKNASRISYEVPTEEILRQARYLENFGQELVMSRSVWNAFKEAVRGRAEHAARFAEEEPEHEGNAGHVYFLDILRQVVDMITKHDKELTLHNLFESFQDIELPNDTSETATLDVPSDESTTDGALFPTPPARYEPATDSKEELRLRWLCFKGEADSIISWAASLLSDLALELIHKLEDDMTDDRDMVQVPKLIESASLQDWVATTLALSDFRMERKEKVIMACRSIPDPAGTASARLQHSEDYVMLPEDSHFLRKNNPLILAKLALNLQFLQTEIGFEFGNDDCSLLLMCHLYNALRQLGYLDIPWETFDSLIDMHIKCLFLGALPTESVKQMFNHACIACGCLPELVRARNSGNAWEGTIKNLIEGRDRRPDALRFPTSMAIVADHLHDREPLHHTLKRLDAEMVTKHTRASENSRVKSFLDEETPMAFLDRLRNHVADFPRYFALDCIELTRVCSGLLKKLMTDEMRTLMKHAI
ncbi:hypothetical protein J4E91_003551 [Alternaria rosae]|nr:hypothetical protein J4E91_003551 [Alternaria rosae]